MGRSLEKVFRDLGLPYPRPSQEALVLARKYGYLPYMIERYVHLFKTREELLSFLESVERGLPKYIRCNTLAIDSCDCLVDRLKERGWSLSSVSWIQNAYAVKGAPGLTPLGSTLEYLLGYFYIQGLGSMCASVALNPKENEIVADLAAAPGGKTTHIAQLMNNRGIIVSVEKDPVRALSLQANISRMRVKIAVVIVRDVLELKFRGLFDRVLLDAPCTGEGLLPIKKERKTSRDLADIAKMHGLQVKLLSKAVDMLRPYGTLTYSTCSIAPEENEFVINKVVENRDDVEVTEINSLNVGEPGVTEFMGYELSPEMKKCRRLYPHKHSSEGFFICNIRRTATG